MFRKTRIFVIILFLFAIGVFSGYSLYQRFMVDKKPPVITMDQPTIHVKCADPDSEYLKGVTAQDNKDGDVTDSLMIETKTNFIEPGRFKVSIAAFDKDNNISKVNREIIYDDYESPEIKIEQDLRFPATGDTSKFSTSSILSRISAHDRIDGDISAQLQITYESDVNITRAGKYEATVSVTNSFGDVSKLPITIEVYDPNEE